MTTPQPRPGILQIKPYVPGKSSVVGRAATMKLSANESALGPSANAVEAYGAAARSLHRYPDGESTELRTAIGARHGLDVDRIVCGAGSDELLYNLVRG